MTQNAALDEIRARGFVAEVRTTLGGAPAPRAFIPIAEHTAERARWEGDLGEARAQAAALAIENEHLRSEAAGLRAELARVQKPKGKR